MFFDPLISDPAGPLDNAKAGTCALLAIIGVLFMVGSWFLA